MCPNYPSIYVFFFLPFRSNTHNFNLNLNQISFGKLNSSFLGIGHCPKDILCSSKQIRLISHPRCLHQVIFQIQFLGYSCVNVSNQSPIVLISIEFRCFGSSSLHIVPSLVPFLSITFFLMTNALYLENWTFSNKLSFSLSLYNLAQFSNCPNCSFSV